MEILNIDFKISNFLAGIFTLKKKIIVAKKIIYRETHI